MEYLRQQWNNPTLTEEYLIQLTAEVRRGWVAKPEQVKVEDSRMVFKFGKDIPGKEITEDSAEVQAHQMAVSKAKWSGLTGKIPTKK